MKAARLAAAKLERDPHYRCPGCGHDVWELQSEIGDVEDYEHKVWWQCELCKEHLHEDHNRLRAQVVFEGEVPYRIRLIPHDG